MNEPLFFIWDSFLRSKLLTKKYSILKFIDSKILSIVTVQPLPERSRGLVCVRVAILNSETVMRLPCSM